MLTLTDVSTPEGPLDLWRNSQTVTAERVLKERGGQNSPCPPVQVSRELLQIQLLAHLLAISHGI